MTIRIALCAALLSPLFAGCDDGNANAAARERGQRLLAQYQCSSCHSIPDVPGAHGGVGPTLEHFGARSYIAGQVPNNRDTLVRWIVEPESLVPGTLMPDMGVSEQDARDMAAYLSSLQ